jgi:hypothetical protein
MSRSQLTRRQAVLFMVIERFRNDDAKAVYSRFQAKGRMLPDGLKYVDSWVEAGRNRCFQLMECADVQLFQEWIAHWNDLVDFEIVAVHASKDVIAGHEAEANSLEDGPLSNGVHSS